MIISYCLNGVWLNLFNFLICGGTDKIVLICS